MPKAKKYSLDYWVKKCMNAWSPDHDILAAVQTYVKGGEHPAIEFSWHTVGVCNGAVSVALQARHALDGLLPDAGADCGLGG